MQVTICDICKTPVAPEHRVREITGDDRPHSVKIEKSSEGSTTKIETNTLIVIGRVLKVGTLNDEMCDVCLGCAIDLIVKLDYRPKSRVY